MAERWERLNVKNQIVSLSLKGGEKSMFCCCGASLESYKKPRAHVRTTDVRPTDCNALNNKDK